MSIFFILIPNRFSKLPLDDRLYGLDHLDRGWHIQEILMIHPESLAQESPQGGLLFTGYIIRACQLIPEDVDLGDERCTTAGSPFTVHRSGF